MQVGWLNSGLTFFPESKDETEALLFLKYFFWSLGYSDRWGITHKVSLEQPPNIVETCPSANGGDGCDKEPVSVEFEPSTKKKL
jgi:hypothetical protein